MADDQHEPHTSPAPGAAEPLDPSVETTTDATVDTGRPAETTETTEEVVEVVEAEIIEVDTVDADAADPAAQASESLAAAAAASAAATTTTTAAADAPAAAPSDWQIDGASEVPPQYVVVEAPQAPVHRGNRGIGALLALAGAVIYGGILFGVAYLLEYLAGRASIDFVQDWHFYLPIIIFAIVFVLLVLLVNRAGWWSYILGSLVVGLAVYFGTAGAGALLDQWTGAAQQHSVSDGLQAVFVILAAIIAREVSVWWGSLIAYRGRRVTARNRAAREAYDRDMTEFRARYGG